MEEEALNHECISPRKAPAPAPEVVGGDLTRSEIEALYAATTSAAGALAPAVDAALVAAFGARVALLPHQRSALAWMLARGAASAACSPDEPGLGKTLTCLALVATDWAAKGRKRARAADPGRRADGGRAGAVGRRGEPVLRFGGCRGLLRRRAERPRGGVGRRRPPRAGPARRLRPDGPAQGAPLPVRGAGGRGAARRAPLFHVDWRRVVVDEVQDVEGRSAGADVARELPAERRWGVSGTPVGKGGLDALFGLFSFLGAEPYRDADWWAAHVRRPLKGGTRTERDAALATAGAAMAELVWRSRKAVASAPLLPASSAFRLKQQHFLPAAVVEPGAAEVAATRPGVADLLAGAVAAAADAGYEKCESELSSKDARALLSGAASKKKRRKGAQSFQGLCRAATAVALCETAGARGDDAPPASDEVSDWIRCDACDKWRKAASAALGHLALAAALRFQRGGVHTVFTTAGSYAGDEAGGSPFASEAVAFLLDAQSICRDGASADEVLANSRRGGSHAAAVAGRKLSGVPPSVLTVVLERLEVEQRQRVRRLRSDPNDDLAGGGGGLDKKLHFATMRALVYGRSRRRVATAMARHRRLGAASPARRCPNQAWPQIWAFVDGGAGDYVAEMLERVATAPRKQAFRATAGADARNLEARRDNVDHGAFEARALDLGVDGVFGHPDADAPRCLRGLVVACLHWAPPAGGPSSREYEEAYVEWCADGAGHLGALGRMETATAAMAAPGPFWASRRAGDLDPKDLAPAAVFARRVRVAKAVRAVALARVQRLDSKSETTVHRYVTGGSIEDAIWQLRLSKATAAGELRTRVTKADVYDLFKSQLAAARGAE
ncbi:ATP binding protein [Aureococcus anophagefferens]|nr:ATP binding protein [Aureococcus anophagefferens]